MKITQGLGKFSLIWGKTKLSLSSKFQYLTIFTISVGNLPKYLIFCKKIDHFTEFSKITQGFCQNNSTKIEITQDSGKSICSICRKSCEKKPAFGETTQGPMEKTHLWPNFDYYFDQYFTQSNLIFAFLPDNINYCFGWMLKPKPDH